MSEQDEIHYRKLENMYKNAPINKLIKSRAEIGYKKAVVIVTVDQSLFHAANAMHGAIYFKALDDSSFFSANSIVKDVFVLTISFTTYLTKPVSEGELLAEAKLVNYNNSQYIAESVLYNNDKEVGRGSGIFVKGKFKLNDVPGYRL